MKSSSHYSRVLPSSLDGVFATYSASGRHFDRHWHDVYGIGLLDQGGQSWASGRGPVDAYAGDVINTNPGEVHDGRPLGGPTRDWRIISIDPDVMKSFVLQSDTFSEITRPVIDDATLASRLRAAFASLEHWNAQPNAIDALAFEESLAEACMLLMSRHSTVAPRMTLGDKDLRIVRDRLADDPTVTPSLAEMAAMTGLSRFQVLRRYKAQYGLSPHAWLLCQRAQRARALIRRGSTLAQAAAASGFADQSHMTRVFARHYGYTPGAWLRAVARTQSR